MSRRLPSLTALRAFEAAARHERFSDAAEELFVTHAAISRQIRELEQWLGFPLFKRHPRGVYLTEPGKRYAARLTKTFDGLAAATRDALEQGAGSATLKLSVEPSLAIRWLLNRLPDFRSSHPNIDLSIDPSPWVEDLHGEDLDIALRYGEGDWQGLVCDKIVEVHSFPVAAPSIAGSLKDPRDLRQATLLHEESRDWWGDWLAGAGYPEVAHDKGPMMGDTALALQAAVAEQGVALGDNILAADDMEKGQLVQLFGYEMPSGGYWLVGTEEAVQLPAVKAFAHWLKEQIAPFAPRTQHQAKR